MRLVLLAVLLVLMIVFNNYVAEEKAPRKPNLDDFIAPPQPEARRDPPPAREDDRPAGPALVPRPDDPIGQVESGPRSGNTLGTAFSIDESQGLWFTARHVVEGCHSVYLSHQRKKYFKVARVWIHKNSDIALLSGAKPKVSVKLASAPPGRGADGFHYGFPQGTPAAVRTTAIGRQRLRHIGRSRYEDRVIVWAEVRRDPNLSGSLGGLSGGPVFNRRGEVVGVTSAESKRRGRIMTTAPAAFGKMFEQSGVDPAARGLNTMRDLITPQNWTHIGAGYRKSALVLRVYCKAFAN